MSSHAPNRALQGSVTEGCCRGSSGTGFRLIAIYTCARKHSCMLQEERGEEASILWQRCRHDPRVARRDPQNKRFGAVLRPGRLRWLLQGRLRICQRVEGRQIRYCQKVAPRLRKAPCRSSERVAPHRSGLEKHMERPPGLLCGCVFGKHAVPGRAIWHFSSIYYDQVPMIRGLLRALQGPIVCPGLCGP